MSAKFRSQEMASSNPQPVKKLIPSDPSAPNRLALQRRYRKPPNWSTNLKFQTYLILKSDKRRVSCSTEPSVSSTLSLSARGRLRNTSPKVNTDRVYALSMLHLDKFALGPVSNLTKWSLNFKLFSSVDKSSSFIDEQHVLELLKTYKTASESSRPDIFTNLVHSLRKFSHPQLIKLFYNQINDKESRNFVLDAIPLLKTDAGITLMKDLVESEVLPDSVLDMWFSTLPYYHNPTRGMITTAAVTKNILIGVAASKAHPIIY